MALIWRLLSVVLSLGVCALQLCIAQDCNVTVEADQTVYRVPPVTASDCEHYWSNATGSMHTVLAHHKGGKGEVVRSNNISTLITSQCFNHIIYKCQCFPKLYYQVNCTTSCKPAHLEMDGTGRLSTGAIVAIALLLLAVAAGVIFWVHRKSRICHYGPVKSDLESSSCGDQVEE